MLTRSRLRNSRRLRQNASRSAPTLCTTTLEQVNAAAREKARRNKTLQHNKSQKHIKQQENKSLRVQKKGSKTATKRRGTSSEKKTTKTTGSARCSPSEQRENSSDRRSKSPRSRKRNVRQEVAEDLRKRIQAIPIKCRSVPQSNNIRRLALELKIRLGTKCLPFHVNGRRGSKCHVTQIPQRERKVPIWGITREQDPVFLSEEKVVVTNWKSLIRKWG